MELVRLNKSMEHEYTKPTRIADGKLYYGKD
jgi:hypothetical protein